MLKDKGSQMTRGLKVTQANRFSATRTPFDQPLVTCLLPTEMRKKPRDALASPLRLQKPSREMAQHVVKGDGTYPVDVLCALYF